MRKMMIAAIAALICVLIMAQSDCNPQTFFVEPNEVVSSAFFGQPNVVTASFDLHGILPSELEISMVFGNERAFDVSDICKIEYSLISRSAGELKTLDDYIENPTENSFIIEVPEDWNQTTLSLLIVKITTYERCWFDTIEEAKSYQGTVMVALRQDAETKKECQAVNFAAPWASIRQSVPTSNLIFGMDDEWTKRLYSFSVRSNLPVFDSFGIDQVLTWNSTVPSYWDIYDILWLNTGMETKWNSLWDCNKDDDCWEISVGFWSLEKDYTLQFNDETEEYEAQIPVDLSVTEHPYDEMQYAEFSISPTWWGVNAYENEFCVARFPQIFISTGNIEILPGIPQ